MAGVVNYGRVIYIRLTITDSNNISETDTRQIATTTNNIFGIIKIIN